MSSPKNKRSDNTYAIGDAIQELLDAYRLNDRFTAAQVVTSWEKLMGAPIARRTSKVFLKDKTLFVELNSAPLKHELNAGKSKVLSLICREFGQDAVKEIVFL
jgi:predicted nucleic acid-binding Zn ribbon protein